MAGLTGKTIGSSFPSLLRVNDNNGVGSSLTAITDGVGNPSCIEVSDDSLLMQPKTDDTTSAFKVSSQEGTALLTVDSTNSLVKAGESQVNVLTHYAYFGANNTQTANFVDDTHHALPFNNAGYGDVSYPPAFGTGSNPITTFSTAEANGTRASDIVPCLWYVNDAITIDSVKYLFGADTAAGDLNRAELWQYTFASGSTSCLSDGTEIAASSTLDSGGSAQALLHSWSAPSAGDVDAGKVVLCLVKGFAIDSDNSWQIIIKYHIR